MKYLIPFSILLIISFVSCRKQHTDTPEKVCNSSLYAFRYVGHNAYALIEVDPETGKGAATSYFPPIRHVEYEQPIKNNCLYGFQADSAGELILYKFDLKNKTTETLRYTGVNITPNTLKDAELCLSYSAALDKFYYTYIYFDSRRNLYTQFYEITISGNSFSDTTLIPDPTNFSIYRPAYTNDRTGEMYVKCSYTGWCKYDLASNKIKNTFRYKEFFLEYNNSDNNFYCLSENNFCKIDATTDVLTTIDTLKFLNGTNGGDFVTSDQCKQQYIIGQFKYGSDTTIDIYWLDMKTGAIKKHINARDEYYGLFNVNN